MTDATIHQMLQDISAQLAELKAAQKPFMTVEEAAEFLSMSKAHLYKLTSTQAVPHYKPAECAKLYFKRDELEAWLLQNRVRPVNEISKAARRHVAGV